MTGLIKNRFIGENIRFILDLVDYYSNIEENGIIFMIDFEKAFDRVEWDFIFACLKFFNFGDSFTKWIRTFYSNNSACVINNGFSSPTFKITRGVRQGCPLSPYIFIICAEVLALSIIDNPVINGISILGTNVKIMQYADDTTLFIDGSFDSLSEVMNTFRIFEISSGLKINIDKSKLFPLGKSIQFILNFPHLFGLEWTIGPVTVLGITFSNNKDQLFIFNYTPKLSRLKRLLHVWSQRDLTPIGKITIVKSIALSQLVFLFQVQFA